LISDDGVGMDEATRARIKSAPGRGTTFSIFDRVSTEATPFTEQALLELLDARAHDA
jgi:hypothetical protein